MNFIFAAVQATNDEASKSHEIAVNTKVNQFADPYNHMAIEDCKEMVQDAIADPHASFSAIGDHELHTLNDRVDKLLNWLSAVYACQTTCMEQIEKQKYKSATEDDMINARCPYHYYPHTNN